MKICPGEQSVCGGGWSVSDKEFGVAFNFFLKYLDSSMKSA